MTADDYNKPTLEAFAWSAVVRYYLLHALGVAAIAWLLAAHWLQAGVVAATAIATLMFTLVLGFLCLNWRRHFLRTVRHHYTVPEFKAILGPHTLELTDTGLESVGPMHKTFRDWRSLISVAVGDSAVIFHTAFGVAYVLPRRAVSDLSALTEYVKKRTTCKWSTA